MQIETVKVSSLIPDPANVRKHPEKNLLAIKGSLARFGQQKPIVVNHKNIVVAGNGTLEAAKSLGWTEIKIVRSDLSGSMATAFAIADNRTSELAEWDDSLLSLQLDALKHDGFDLDDIGFGDFDFSDDETQDRNSESNDYTKKIKIPIYEPKGDKPAIATLFDNTKTKALIAEIDALNVADEIKHFLRLAAQRHTVFDYEKIAEFYSHAPKEIQSLFENSALVIIDFDKAIENGFAVLTEKLAEVYSNDRE